MTPTKDLLAQLAETHAAADLLALDMEAQINALIPAEIRQQIADLRAEYGEKQEAAKANIEDLQAAIRAQVIEEGASVKGDRMLASYIKGRVTWDAAALDGYALAHPELFAFRREGEPSVAIRFRGK